MGIKTECTECGKEIEFPNCPNAETDIGEKLAFSLYTMFANDPARKCMDCRMGKKAEEGGDQ